MKKLTVLPLAAAFAMVSAAWATTTSAGSAPPDDDLMEVLASDPLSGTPGSGLTRGVTDDSIKIGCVYGAAGFAGYDEGARARFERANAEGGVHGRMIDFLGCEDDANDPLQFTSLVTQLVEQEEVFGILAEGAGAQSAFDYMNENEVPYTGWGYLPGYCGTRWGFGWNGCSGGTILNDAVPHAVNQSNLAESILIAAGLDGADVRVAIQLDDAISGTTAQDTFQGAWEHAGATVVYNETTMPIPSPTDFTPFVQPVLDADPNVIVVATTFTSVGGFTASLRAAGFEGVILNYVAYVPGLLGASPQLAEALAGSYVSTQLVPQEEQTPYVQMIEADLTAIEAENGSFITLGAGLGYAEANLFVTLLDAAGEDLNTATFDEAANTTGVTVEPGAEGGIGVTQWPQSHFIPTDCSGVVLVEDGAYTVAEPFACYEPFRIR